MQRRGGKRIRMDDPPPPEYESPMTPMTPLDGSGTELQEPYTPYTPYSNQPATPLHTGSDMYGNSEYSEATASQAYQQQQQQQLYEQQTQQFDVQQQQTLSSYDQTGQYDQPPTPVNMVTRVRVTRARVRAAAAAAAPPPPPPPAAPAPMTATVVTTRRGGLAVEEPKKRRPGRRPMSELMAEDENSLYYIIRQGKVSLQAVVDDWIESYKVNRDAALLSLMQFFINASGCKGKITSYMQASMEHAAIIRRMTEEFDEESGEYPLIMTGQTWKKFRNNFCDFVQILVKQCQYSIIYDQYLMDNVISLLTGLSDSQVRAFRHTATLAAMKLMTALVDVALTVSVNLDNTQRQYEAERQKARDKRASDRLESLMSKRQELEENMDEIKNMLTYMFKSVFVHRYRDTLPEIRAICMAEIGVWMKKFHQNFLDDSYLKYIGWTLHDKVGEVRLKCLQALQPLYASEELKGKLELFTSKFKDRIVAMTLDKEYDVAVQAVRLVISILKHHRDILTDKDCEHVYELVYSSHRAVAQAAGEFLNERLFVPDEEAVAGIRTKRGKKRLPNTPLIRDLVQFFIESELHEHGAYLVDSLIESNEMMKDWECMTDLLLEEPGPSEEALDDRQETSLIEIMVCCIRQAATGEPPVGRGPTRKILSAKEIKQVQDDKLRLTEHYIQTLPAMLDKYRADPEKLANLLSIPQYFELDIYTTSRQETNLDLLLKKMASIVEKHHDTDVLETCAKTLELLCTDGNAIFTRCDVARSTLIDMVVNKYKEAVDDWRSLIEGEETPDEDETFNVVYSLKKVATFYNCHNLGNWGIWDSIFKDISDAKDGNKTLPEEAVRYCISAGFFAILWDLHHLEEVMESGANGSVQLQQLKSRLHTFMDTMKEMLMSGQNQSYMEEAYLTLCDLLVVFCEQLASNSQLVDLVYEPDRGLQIQLNDFIQNYVFIMEEDDEQDEHSKIEELHKRRNFLASFCKLIVYNMMPTKVAADVFKHYVKYYNDYGDIIKATLGKAREINKTNCARTMAISLTMLFRELQRDGTRINRQSEDFISLKELAKRFALSFGLDAVKNREAITALHREGILFSVNPLENSEDPTGPPPNLPFLEILTEFTNKLLKQDKRVVLTFLDRRIAAGMPSSRGEDWQPLLMYRNSLVHGETDQPPVTSKRAYSRKKKEYAEEEEQGEEAEEATSDQEFNTGRKRRLLSSRSGKRRVQQQHQPHKERKLDVRVVKHEKPQSRGKKCSENAMLLSSEPSIQEETSLSHLSMTPSSGKNSKQQHSFLTSTRLFGNSGHRSFVTNDFTVTGYQND
ncbi:cohesin subunit SA-2 isoform X2 [Zootermopsis nevadensis]|uniref:cohesin subunit SA-2 isoform X2 n=1 Tax=Zootermopsis nevadensis TaxID=136037 RepID=UPI000B8E9927|nr:cohesin subunit SA-2 isoform X2 [Zootermopsis nevadensis]